MLNEFVFHLSHDFHNFRWPEIKSVLEQIGHPNCMENATYSDDSALFHCNLPSRDIAEKLAARCVMIKSISDLYCQADNLDNLIKQISSLELPCEIQQNDTIKIDFYSFGHSYSEKEKLEIISKLGESIDFKTDVKVCLNNKLVKHRFVYFEDWIHIKGKPDESSKDLDESLSKDSPLLISDDSNSRKYLNRVYFGKYALEGQNDLVWKYNLKHRGFISNTTMDPLLSLVMSNMGHAASGKIIMDPFVGSGSLLVAAAHYGAHVMGADLNYNLINSKGLSSRQGQKYRNKDESIRNNLKQYGLEDYFIDIFVADFSTKYLKDSFKYDAIITDPPYGIREKAKKIGNKNKEQTEMKDENSNDIKLEDKKIEEKSIVDEALFGVPQQVQYNLGEIFYDLLSFALDHLVDGGRLVYWLPIFLTRDRSKMTETELNSILTGFIPLKEGLSLLAYNEQRLTKFNSRILITMVREEKKIQTSQDSNVILIKNTKDSLNSFRENYFSTKK